MGQVGLAIGRDRVLAVEARPAPAGRRVAHVRHCPLAAGPAEGNWPELWEALATLLRREDGGRVTRVSIALLPDLARAKVVTLPPVRRAEQRGLVARNPSRYFLGADGAVVADVAPLGRQQRGTPSRVLAVCAEASVMEAVVAAVTQAGLVCDGITAAAPALAAAVTTLVPWVRRETVVVVAPGPEGSQAIAMRAGTPGLVAAWPQAPLAALPALAAGVADAAFGPPGAGGRHSVLVVGGEEQEALVAACAVQEALLPRPAEVLTGLDAAALAAWGATLTSMRSPQLLPDRLRQDAARLERRRTGWLAAAAALLLMAAGGAHRWGLQRELAAVRAARRAHAANVREVLALQRDLDAVQAQLIAVDSTYSGERSWTNILATLARALPDSAYLVAFAADSGGVRLDGIAAGATDVAVALESSPLLREVTLITAFRPGGADNSERFALTMSINSAARRGEKLP